MSSPISPSSPGVPLPAPAMRTAALMLAVSLSGAASLMYQLAWTRRLITVTSATATSQALVLAIFMAGLGAGAAIGGRWVVRLSRPVLGYVAVEIAGAVLALLSMVVVSWSEGIGASFGQALQLVFAGGYFLIITTLLGMSLPFLIEAALGDDESPERRGRIVSALYGINTLGAAGGCVVAGFVTIERFGLSQTSALGAALATFAALVATLGAQKRRPVAEPGAQPRSWVERRWLVAAGVGGAVGLGAEVVWTRLLGLIVPSTVYVLTQVLGAVLLGIAAGAALANLVARSARASDEPHQAALRVAGLIAGLGAVLLALIPLVLSALADSAAAQKEMAAGRGSWSMVSLLALLTLTSALVAALLPLLVMVSHAPKGSRAFAGLYAANTAGSVVGSLAVGFVLLPRLGTRLTGLLLQLLLVGLAAGLLVRQGRLVGLAIASLTACLLAYLSNDVPRELYLARLAADTKILDFREGVESNVMVTESPTGERRLWIGSIWVAGTTGPHGAFGHIPALLVARPKRVLGIALGTGQTFAAVFKHRVERLDCVEIDAGVVALSRTWFGEANGGLLDHAQVTVHIDDGRAFLRRTAETYDVIVLEPLQSWTAGTTHLYTREFYEDAKQRLNPGGVVAQWIPFYGQSPRETRAMVRTGLEVFPQASLWLVLRDGVVVYQNDGSALSLETLDERIADRGIATDLLRFPAVGAGDLASHVLLGPRGLRAWADGAEIIEDDRPFLEFRAARAIGSKGKFRRILSSIRPHLDDLSDTISASSAAGQSRVALADKIRRAMFELHFVAPDRPDQGVAILEAVGPEARRSAWWRGRYDVEALRWVRALAKTDPAAAREAALHVRQWITDPARNEADD